MRALIAALLVAVATPVAAADIKYLNRGIVLEGEILEGDDVKFTQAAAQVPKGTNFVLFLNSPGGAVEPAQAMSKVIQKMNKEGSVLYTMVPDGGHCSSACVPLFAMGKRKTLFGSAYLRVHSIHSGDSYEDGSEDSDAMDSTMAMVTFMQQYGTPTSVLTKVLQNSDSYGLEVDDTDLAAWGVERLPAP